MLIVHMSEIEAIETLRQAQKKGLKIFGETCPQYMFLTADDMDKPGVEGAKWCCSPPPRDQAAQEAVWAALKDGTFQVFSSDHAPYQFNETGKIPKGDKTTFKEMANGVPGLEMRLPLLFSEGVQKGRINLQQFVALTSTNHAKLYGLYPKQGHDRRRLRRRHRDLGRRQGRHDPLEGPARQCRLHALRGPPDQGLADHRGEPRPGRRRGRQAQRRARLGPVPALRLARFGQAAGPDGARAAGDVALRREAAVLTGTAGLQARS